VDKPSLTALAALDQAENQLLATSSSEALTPEVRSATAEGAALVGYFAWALAIGPLAIGALSMVPKPPAVSTGSNAKVSWYQGTGGRVGLPEGLTSSAKQAAHAPAAPATNSEHRRSKTQVRVARPETTASSVAGIDDEIDIVQPTKVSESPAPLPAPTNLRVTEPQLTPPVESSPLIVTPPVQTSPPIALPPSTPEPLPPKPAVP
jgi:hypothetical protein